jgi:transcription antitermination factor NusG
MMADSKENTQRWYAARVKYQTEKKITTFFEERGIVHYIPFEKVVRERDGRKITKERPVIPCFIFVYTDYHTALTLPVESGYTINYIRNLETKKLQIIPDKQMQDFMFLLNFSETTFRIESTNLKKGDRVRVIKGAFAGIEGELIRIKGHKRVVIRLEGIFSLVTTYIPGEFLERI